MSEKQTSTWLKQVQVNKLIIDPIKKQHWGQFPVLCSLSCFDFTVIIKVGGNGYGRVPATI